MTDGKSINIKSFWWGQKIVTDGKSINLKLFWWGGNIVTGINWSNWFSYVVNLA